MSVALGLLWLLVALLLGAALVCAAIVAIAGVYLGLWGRE